MKTRNAGLRVVLASVAAVASWSAAAAQETASYRHPAGFTVRYPAQWRIHESLEGVALVPHDAATDGMGQPLELFLLGSDDAPGLSDPADAVVVRYFQQNLPGFRLVGEPERLDTGLGAGSVLTFEGSMGGPPLRQRTYVALHQGKGIFLAHVATAELAARRDAVAREIFRSFSWGDADLDASVVGSWFRESSSMSEGGSGFASSGSTREYTFGPDGSVTYHYESSVSVDVDGLSGFSGSGPQSWTGTYAAGQGVLYMRFDNGQEQEYRYRLTQDASGSPVLELTDAEGEVGNYRRSG